MAHIIYSQKIDTIKPILWYSKPVYAKYKQIIQILSSRVDDEIKNFLLEPNISKEALRGEKKAEWLSDKYSRLKPLKSFSVNVQVQLKKELEKKINKILEIADELENSENEDEKEFADFLRLVVEIPSLDYVYSNGNDIALACWGFKSIELQNKDFKLSKVFENEKKQENDISKSTSIPEENIVEVEPKTKKSNKKIFFIIGILLLLIGLGIYYFKNRGYYQDVTPIDPKKVKIDKKDPMKRKIVTNRLIVMIDMNITNANFKKLIKKKFPNSNIKVVNEEPEIGMLEFEIPAKDRKEWIKKFEKLKGVTTAYVENVVSFNYIPNDVGFKEKKKQWLFKATHAYKGWDKEKGNSNIVIAIIDGAFDLNHPELKNKKIVKAWNAANGTPRLTHATPDEYMHGTHVATTALGIIDNHQGTGGICPGCSFMPIQIGQDNMEGFSSATVIRAILYAIRNNANVINLSIGRSFYRNYSKLTDRQKRALRNKFRRSTLKQEIMYERVFELARKKNIAIVYAAGNDNMYSDIDPQKRSADVLVVGAVNQKLNRARFSNYGENVVVSAPGVQIYSAVPNNKYKYLSGTSMAAPIVSGLIGLIKSENPSLPNDKIYEILVNTGKKINSNKIGPLIQIDKALDEAKKPYSPANEIRKLKEQLRQCKKGKMIIPKKNNNFEFAEGIWKSNHDTIDAKTKERLDIYFDIKKNGKGNILLKLPKNNNECKAKIQLAFKTNELIIKQTDIAVCTKNHKYYSPYEFHCYSINNEVATCKATGSTNFSFELVRSK